MNKLSIFEQLVSLTKATIEQVRAGMPIATQEVQDERAKICSECPLLDSVQYRCNSCGCWLRYKLPWATSKCPEGNWGEEKGKNMKEFSTIRLEICNSCPYNSENICILCGCDILEKVEDINESCPKIPKAWGPYKDPKPVRESPQVQLGMGGVSSTAPRIEGGSKSSCGSCQTKTR